MKKGFKIIFYKTSYNSFFRQNDWIRDRDTTKMAEVTVTTVCTPDNTSRSLQT